MKDWEVYESQIFEKLRRDFPNAEIKKNQKIIGKYSERSRQIDVLVKSESIGRNLIIVIDCKKFSKRIDVKTVEAFIGFAEDVGAHIGVMITNVGYTKSAEKRANNHHRDIQLDIVEFDKFEDYDFSFDSCYKCKDDDDFPRGIIQWNRPSTPVFDEVITLVDTGSCSYCGEFYIKCQGCGDILSFDDEDQIECSCESKFVIESEYIGSGMTEDRVIAYPKRKKPLESIDPNQTNLFED